MGRPLRTLIVEDSPDDALLVVEALRHQGYEPEYERVEDPPAMRAALQQREWDVIISDYNLPRFSAPAALYLMRQLGLDLPFIIVSGVIGEESAVNALKAGAHDFVLKGSFARLGTAIEREVREAHVRREARRVKAVLEESEAYFRALTENSSDLITILDRDLSVRYQSPSIERMLGYRPEDLVGTHGLSRVHPEDAPRIERALQGALAGTQAGAETFRVRRKDGSWRVHEAIGRNLLDNPAVQGIVIHSRDVTERVEAEEALRRSETKYRRLIETAEEGVWIVDGAGRTTFVNEKMARMLGYRVAEMIGLPAGDFVSPEDRPRALALMAYNRIETGHYDARLLCKDGTRRWFLLSTTPIADESGANVGGLAMCTDITDRREAEEQVRASEVHFRSLIEGTSDVVVILDAQGRLTYATPSVNVMLGYAPDEMIGQDMFQLVHADDRPRVQEVFAAACAAPAAIRSAEYRFRHKDGGWRIVHSTATNLLDEPAVKGVVVNTRDVTEHRSLESRLHQSQRLEAIGRLAGGMAHDFNNILTVIRTSAEFLLEGLPAGDPLRADAAEVVRSADRAASLTRQLLAFSKRQVLQPRVLDVNTVVGDLERMLRRLISEDVALTIERGADEQRVRADPAQLEQVIMNLTVNSRDAMPNGGKLLIRTGGVILGEGDLAGHPGCRPGRYVELTVRDTGCGMSPDVRERIFEPFFTTKERGTGLGLPMVYGIVQQSGGFVTVESEEGRGTAFTVYLPAAAEGVAPATEVHPQAQHGSEVVLLTEDDQAVRTLARRCLERMGYEVLEADGADAALDIARRHQGPINLLLTDVVMPGKSGRELAIAFAQLRPEGRVAYMSGYADRGIQGALPPDAVLVEKPFTPASLALKLREALGAPVRT